MNAVDRPQPTVGERVDITHSHQNVLGKRQMRSGAIISRVIRRVAAYLALVMVVISMAFPLIWMILSSFKSEREIYHYPPTIIPQHFTLEAYQGLFRLTAFSTWFRNSVFVSVVVTLIALTLSAMGAYALARFRYGFFRVFSRVILFAYMVPSILMVIPIFQIVWRLQLGNKLSALLLVYNAILLPYGIWTLRAYFAGIPHEIEEAALIDGASRFQAFYKVVLPQALPGLISTALFAFHVAWNEYLFASVLLWSSRSMTLSAGVSTLIGETAMYSWSLLMAAAVLVTLPVVVLFSLLQGFLIAGWGGGAVKG
ncbi:MAG TPA: carbohydrate ABC transporter permease [Anaerolineales bacterium]|nr:carbohydrate ABC transporter permease [Anaerolineales bacterium]